MKRDYGLLPNTARIRQAWFPTRDYFLESLCNLPCPTTTRQNRVIKHLDKTVVFMVKYEHIGNLALERDLALERKM